MIWWVEGLMVPNYSMYIVSQSQDTYLKAAIQRMASFYMSDKIKKSRAVAVNTAIMALVFYYRKSILLVEFLSRIV